MSEEKIVGWVLFIISVSLFVFGVLSSIGVAHIESPWWYAFCSVCALIFGGAFIADYL